MKLIYASIRYRAQEILTCSLMLLCQDLGLDQINSLLNFLWTRPTERLITRRHEQSQIARVNWVGASMVIETKSASHSELGIGRLAEMLNRWPVIPIVIGLVLTAVWIGFLFWSASRLLHLV
jgi:hypothetical protein